MAHKTQQVELGKTGLKINPVGLGCMGMSFGYGKHPSEEESIKTIHRALDLGVNFFDTAYVYAWGVNEELLGKAIRSAIKAGKIKREDVVIATKFGWEQTPEGGRIVTSTPESVRRVTEASLKRLDLGYIDLLYQHRVDPNTPIEDTVKTVVEFIKKGVVKSYGLSEAAAATVRRAHAVHPVAALQSEYSLWTLDPETNDSLATCRELGITFVAYSPLGRGFLTGSIKKFEDFDADDVRRQMPRFMGENFQKNLQLVEDIKKFAQKKKCTPSQLALAWVLHQKGVVAIPGTTKIENLEENMGTEKVTFTDEDEKEIRKLLNDFVISGPRYVDAMMKAIQL